MSRAEAKRFVPVGRYWPSREQELLLQATLWPGTAAVDSYHAWKTAVDLDGLDWGSYRMLPLLYHNMNRLGIHDPWLSKCKGLQRQTWYRNHMWLHRAGTLLQRFNQVGIKVMMLKGAALALFYYQNLGLRPLEDVDLLVPAGQVQGAFSLLSRLGWRPPGGFPNAIPDGHLGVMHALSMENGNDVIVDLHWHLLFESLGVAADDDFWQSAERVEANGVPVYVLNRTDQLFHTCVHGFRNQVGWSDVSPIRWVADAVTIMACGRGAVDFQRLRRLAQQRQLTLALKLTMMYLRDTFMAPITAERWPDLENWPVTDLEASEYRSSQKPSGILGSLPLMHHHYLRLRSGWGEASDSSRFGFLEYLRCRFLVGSWRDLPMVVMAKGWRRIKIWAERWLRWLKSGRKS